MTQLAKRENAAYPYGFNGKLRDDEIKGSGNSMDFGGRVLDTRLGRWMSVDPEFKRYPFSSPFVAMGNNPIYYVDPSGETLRVAGNEAARQQAQAALQLLTNDEVSVQQDGLVVIKNGNQNPSKNLVNGTDLIRLVSSHSKTATIHITNSGGNTTTPDENGNVDIDFNPSNKIGGVDIQNNEERPPQIGLGHELIHGALKFIGQFIEDNHDTKFSDPDNQDQESQTIDYEEYNTRVLENALRQEQGVTPRKIPQKVETGGPPIQENSEGLISPQKPIEIKKNPAYD